MFVQAHCFVDFKRCLEREAMDHIADNIAPLFDIAGPRARIGLLIASDNAGTATSVQFWADALRTGLGLASPERFPWCLANAPCGALARRFGVTGPNSTLLGQTEALLGALDTSADLFAQDQIDSAIIVVLCFASADLPGRALALRLHNSADEPDGAGFLGWLYEACATQSLRAAIDTLDHQVNTREAPVRAAKSSARLHAGEDAMSSSITKFSPS